MLKDMESIILPRLSGWVVIPKLPYFAILDEANVSCFQALLKYTFSQTSRNRIATESSQMAQDHFLYLLRFPIISCHCPGWNFHWPDSL